MTKRATRGTVVALMAALWLCAGCKSQRTTPTIELHQRRPTTVALRSGGGYALLNTAIDGRDAGWFMLDTGSNVTAVERGTANRLGLRVVAHGSAAGIAGSERIDFRSFDSVSVAGFQLRPRALGSLSFTHMRTGWAGLLGFDALADETFTLDQHAGTLTIGDTIDDGAHVERLYPWFGLPVVEVKLGGHTLKLLLDSGADNELSLHEDVVRKYPDVLSVPHSGAGWSRGVGGSVSGALTWVKSVELFGVTLGDVPVSIAPRPAGLSDPDLAGRVGNALLRHFRLTFDAPHHRIAATWQPQ